MLKSVFAVLLLLSSPASSHIVCTSSEKAKEVLDMFGESSVMFGTAGNLFEWWVNEKTRTWTITRTTPDGVLCFMAFGKGWGIIDLKDVEDKL